MTENVTNLTHEKKTQPLSTEASLKAQRRLKVARIASVPEAFLSVTKNFENFKDLGFDVDLICSNSEYGQTLRNEFGFNVITCKISRSISVWNDLISIYKLTLLFLKNDYDIVHSNTPKAGFITCLAGILSFRKVRLHTFTGQRWITLENPLKTIMKWLDKVIIRLNTCCYADSNSQIQLLIEENVAKKNQIICLGNGSFGGIDINKFNKEHREQHRQEISAQYNIPENELWCLYVGRIVNDKGINELVRAYLEVSQKHRFHLVLAGFFEDGLDPIDPHIKAEILNNPCIHFVGFQKDIARFMRSADFLCLPSYREGFGSVIIESAACGLPSIGTDISGVRDAIVNNQTGLLVPVKDVPALATAMTQLVTHTAQRVLFGQNAYQRARQDFDCLLISKLQAAEYRRLHALTHPS